MGPAVEPVGEGAGEGDGGRVGGEAAALEEEDAGGGCADEAGVVGREEDETAVGDLGGGEQPGEGAGLDGVRGGERVVEEQDVGLVQDRVGEGARAGSRRRGRRRGAGRRRGRGCAR